MGRFTIRRTRSLLGNVLKVRTAVLRTITSLLWSHRLRFSIFQRVEEFTQKTHKTCFTLNTICI
jgi:hypothetical protein